MTTITQETIRFTVGHIRHPNPIGLEDADTCTSCDQEAIDIEADLIAWLSNQEVESETTPEPEPRGLCRWHPWGCPTGRGYYEGPRLVANGPPLTRPSTMDKFAGGW